MRRRRVLGGIGSLGLRGSIALLESRGPRGSLAALGLGAWSARAAFQDPLDTPAPRTRRIAGTPLFAVARAGSRRVATGMRGLVIVSDDGGAHWQQAEVPVSCDLVAVCFANAQLGWIAGHDGVLLHTDDGGGHWHKQLDGRLAEPLLRRHFQALAAAGDPRAPGLLAQLAADHAHGPEQPLLDVAFDGALCGFACGAFGLLLGTTDGGREWRSWIERVDNPRQLHLNAVRRIGGAWYLASEAGTVFRLAPQGDRFTALTTGYAGSFFGVVGDARTLLVHGLRGSLYRSSDAGAHWERMNSGTSTGLTASVRLADGRFVLASQAGELLVGDARASAFALSTAPRPGLLTGLCEERHGLIAVGVDGAQVVALP